CSLAPEPLGFKKEPPKEKDFQNPGLRGPHNNLIMSCESRAPHKPNKPITAFGFVTLSLLAICTSSLQCDTRPLDDTKKL
uniref:Uncharacterized protein n=1 Tax=Suricata suricatta TaxID=37032 RepID=A0A673V1A2_SURSU